MVARFTSVQIICMMLKFHFETCFEVGDVMRMDCMLYTDSMFTPNSYKSQSPLCEQTSADIKVDFLNSILWFLSSLFCSMFPVGYGLHQAPGRSKTGCCNGKSITQASLQAPPSLHHLELILTWLWDLCLAEHFCLYASFGQSVSSASDSARVSY